MGLFGGLVDAVFGGGGGSSSAASTSNNVTVNIPTDNIAKALTLGAIAQKEQVEIQAQTKKAELLQEQQFKKAELLQKNKALNELKQLLSKYAKVLIAVLAVIFLIKKRKKR